MQNSQVIDDAVRSWDGVSAHPHRFGGTEYRLGKREIGHIHGERLVDIPFTRKARNRAILEGKAEAHHLLPETGWVSIWLNSEKNVRDAIELLEQSYSMAREQIRNRQARVAASTVPEPSEPQA
jgi:Family of unknown function (DUF5519)